MNIRVTRLTADEAAELALALETAGLPIEDLDEEGRTFFKFEDRKGLVGFGGLEGLGAERLLRSLVVAPLRQRQGLGRKILAAIEEEARKAATQRLHLLTTTAASFFRKRGYQDAVRADAPPNIRASKEFSSLCPSDAIYMKKSLSI